MRPVRSTLALTASPARLAHPALPGTAAPPHLGPHVARALLRPIDVARTPRHLLVARRSTNHCTWRGHNLTHVLGSAAAKTYFLELLATHKDAYGIEIHSYALMDTHPHVQCRSTLGQKAFSAFWKVVNHRFARWYNRRHGRCGQVIMDRMASPGIQNGRHQLRVMRYGDLNPVRAGIVSSPKDYRWSSYRHYAFGEPDALITDAPEYLALGRNVAERCRAYIHLFACNLPLGNEQRTAIVVGPYVGDADWVSAMLRRLRTAMSATNGGSG